MELLHPGWQADQTRRGRLVLAPGGGSQTQSEWPWWKRKADSERRSGSPEAGA